MDTTENPEPIACSYCSSRFTPTQLHQDRKLLNLEKDDRVLSFCCVACRQQMITFRVAFEERNIELIDERFVDPNANDPRYFDEPAEPETSLVANMTPEQTSKLREFFVGWLRMTPAQRDISAAALCGNTGSQIARLRKISPQAVSQRLKLARKKCPAIERAVPPDTLGIQSAFAIEPEQDEADNE